MEGDEGDRNENNFYVLRYHLQFLLIKKQIYIHCVCQGFQFSFPNSHSSEMLSMQKQRKKIP